MKHRLLCILLLIASSLILGQFIIGACAADNVRFDDPDVSHAEALAGARQASWSDFERASDELLFFPPAAIAIVAVFLFGRALAVRWICVGSAILLPRGLLLLQGDPDNLVPLFTVTIALFVELPLILGTLDGESWSDGFVTYAAVGWWLMIWCGVGLWLGLATAFSRAEERRQLGLCINCGYDLRGSVANGQDARSTNQDARHAGCPECGWNRSEPAAAGRT